MIHAFAQRESIHWQSVSLMGEDHGPRIIQEINQNIRSSRFLSFILFSENYTDYLVLLYFCCY
jgi:hypothetical protein